MGFLSNVHPVAKIAGMAAIAAGLFFGGSYLNEHRSWNVGKVQVTRKATLNDVADASVDKSIKLLDFPSTTCSTKVKNNINIYVGVWEWNAMSGFLEAAGGNCTTKGSLFEKYGVNIHIIRIDDTSVMQTQLVKCAMDLHAGKKECEGGINAVIIMGDGAAPFAAGVNSQLKALGANYKVIAIGAVGYSRGEDACMMPPNVRENPNSFKDSVMYEGLNKPIEQTGILADAVLLDGDWNICQKYIGDNQLPNNPDPTTFDPEAINWTNASDYNVAAADYVGYKCESRKLLDHATNKLTGKTVRVCVNAVATWTPGDVTVATQRGGLVKVADSAVYRSQMPSTLIGPADFIRTHRKDFLNILRATFEAGDQLKLYPEALRNAARISGRVYQDQGGTHDKVDDNGKVVVGSNGKPVQIPWKDGEYWYTYFTAHDYKDPTGLKVSLGGSSVNNLADDAILFGFNGYEDNFAATFDTFREIDLQQYPERFKTQPLPNLKEIEDRSFIEELLKDNDSGTNTVVAGKADEQDFTSAGTGDQVSRQKVYIQFANGKAEPLPVSIPALEKLRKSIGITGLKIQIDGYTDSSSTDAINVPLSQARAQAVKDYLQHTAGKNFPEERFTEVKGHGSQNPVQPNTSAAGMAANRRVEITLTQ